MGSSVVAFCSTCWLLYLRDGARIGCYLAFARSLQPLFDPTFSAGTIKWTESRPYSSRIQNNVYRQVPVWIRPLPASAHFPVYLYQLFPTSTYCAFLATLLSMYPPLTKDYTGFNHDVSIQQRPKFVAHDPNT